MIFAALCLLAAMASAEDISLGLDEPWNSGYLEVKAIQFLDGHAYTEFFDGTTFVYGVRAYQAADVVDGVAYINQAIEVMPSAEEIGRYRRIQIHVIEESGIRNSIGWVEDITPVSAV